MITMPSTNEDQRFEFAQNLIMEAGDLALRYFANLGELSTMSKGARDMVSEADFAVERLIRDRLVASYPEDSYLGEETGHSKAGDDSGTWVVDPIDGTQPFLSGLSTWCISIAYVRSAEVQLGMVNNPAAGELFVGGTGRKAELNGRPIAPDRCSHWLTVLPTLDAIHGSAPNRWFQCWTACYEPMECLSGTDQVHLGCAMSVVDG
jgi:myo-inositol-1(or 4)-monophosphatase